MLERDKYRRIHAYKGKTKKGRKGGREKVEREWVGEEEVVYWRNFQIPRLKYGPMPCSTITSYTTPQNDPKSLIDFYI